MKFHGLLSRRDQNPFLKKQKTRNKKKPLFSGHPLNHSSTLDLPGPKQLLQFERWLVNEGLWVRAMMLTSFHSWPIHWCLPDLSPRLQTGPGRDPESSSVDDNRGGFHHVGIWSKESLYLSNLRKETPLCASERELTPQRPLGNTASWPWEQRSF